MRAISFILATLFLGGVAFAQVGGNTLSKANTANTLGYLQFVTPPPGTVFNGTSTCRNFPFPSFSQGLGMMGGYVVLYDAGGRPHYLLAC